MLNNTWKSEGVWWGVKEGTIDLVSIAEDVPAEAKAKVDEIKAKMKDRSFDVFTGPVVDGDGKERLAAGTKADDDWMGKIDFYVKGVEGKVPASK